MFNVNSWEILIMVALFMVLFGPDRLPRVIGQMVKLIRDLQRMSDSATADLRRELEAATRAADLTSKPPRRPAPRTQTTGRAVDADATAETTEATEATAATGANEAAESVVAHPGREQSADGDSAAVPVDADATDGLGAADTPVDVEASPSIFRKPSDSGQESTRDATSGGSE